VEKILKNVKNVKKRDLNKKRKKTFITSVLYQVHIICYMAHMNQCEYDV